MDHAYVFTFAKKYLQVQGYYRGKADMGRGNERAGAFLGSAGCSCAF